jgi:hypothetical protein
MTETKMIVAYQVQCRKEGAIGKFNDSIIITLTVPLDSRPMSHTDSVIRETIITEILD